jgi:hypothetical protein
MGDTREIHEKVWRKGDGHKKHEKTQKEEKGLGDGRSNLLIRPSATLSSSGGEGRGEEVSLRERFS